MRAAAENPVGSRLVGIRVGWMLALGWGLAADLGAVAGMMAAPLVYLEPNMMSGTLLYGFAGALLGGIDNPWGALLGGFIVGVLENLAGAYVVGTSSSCAVALLHHRRGGHLQARRACSARRWWRGSDAHRRQPHRRVSPSPPRSAAPLFISPLSCLPIDARSSSTPSRSSASTS